MSFTVFTVSAYAQESSFGLTAGYLNTQLKANSESNSVSDNASGFYIGGLTNITITESFHVSVGATYGNAEDTGFLYIPVMAKYYISESGFYLQAGPQASFIFLEDKSANFQTLGLDLGFGAGFEINKHLYVEAKYFLALTNRLEGISQSNDLKLNSLLVGLGYKF